jgi:hypothetical protein
VSDASATKNHVFMLRDLEPSSTYTYSVNNGQTYSFTTPSTDGA